MLSNVESLFVVKSQQLKSGIFLGNNFINISRSKYDIGLFYSVEFNTHFFFVFSYLSF